MSPKTDDPARRAVRQDRRRALAAAAAAAAFGAAYFFVRQYLKDGVWRFDPGLLNKSLAVAALFLVALSMALTGISYFSKGRGRALAYRKPIGLAGFWLGLAHAALDHLVMPALGVVPEANPGGRHAEALGLAALVLLALMALASNGGARERLGARTWRRFLRYAGYAGLGLALAHAAWLKAASWGRFFRTFRPFLPSLSLPVAVFAALAILLRLAVWAAGRRRR